jgi:HemY protein
VAPQLAWAAESTLEELTERGDWDGALKLVEAQKSTRQIERDAAARRRAVLLTAKADALAGTDPATARTAALEANRLAPGFAPAAIAAAKALFAHDDVRKGSKILESAWRAEPHPELADAYVHARPGDAVLDRLARARKLQEMKKNHAESSLAVARAALDAQDYALARGEAEAAIRMDRREGAYLLLADIEEADSGDEGKVRQWLSKAVRAPRDPAWVADGVVSENWAPFSPVTGRLDAFEWRAPTERVGQMIEAAVDENGPDQAILPAPGKETAFPDESENTLPASKPVEDAQAAAPDASVKVPTPRPVEAVVPSVAGTYTDILPPETDEPVRLPDDPGVEPQADEPEKPPRRFRLF